MAEMLSKRGPVRKLLSALSKPSVETKVQMLVGGIDTWYGKICGVPLCKLPISLLCPGSSMLQTCVSWQFLL